jgi:DNA polymerase IV
MKILCVMLPNFPLKCEFMRHSELQENILVTYTVGSQKRIFDYSPGIDGLQRDMSLQQALSLYGDVELVHADMPHYWSVFNSTLDVLEEKSPLADGSDLGEIYMGLDGLHFLYPTDDVLIKAVREAIPTVFDVRMGIASGKFYAYLAALYNPAVGYRTLRSDIKSFLNDLSCDVLPAGGRSGSGHPTIENELHSVNISSIIICKSFYPLICDANFDRRICVYVLMGNYHTSCLATVPLKT